MILTDTHTHIYYQTDEEVLNEMMQRCFSAGVERLFLPNVDLKSIPLINKLTARYPQNCFAMSGLHPCDVKLDYLQVLQDIEDLAQTQQIYAIGEIGIDLYWDKSTLEIQRDAFKLQIQRAKKLNLPIVIHCREAFDEVFEVLEAEQDEKLRGVMHCFTGDLQQAQRAIALNFFLGIGGVLTYKKSGLDAVLQEIPIQHIVLETDAPYLAPVPFRGKPNESSYLVYIAQKLSDIYGLSLPEVASMTTENSKMLFGI